MPPTPLLTSDVLKEENEQWPDVQQGMSLALKEMRVDQVGSSHLCCVFNVFCNAGPDHHNKESKDQFQLCISKEEDGEKGGSVDTDTRRVICRIVRIWDHNTSSESKQTETWAVNVSCSVVLCHVSYFHIMHLNFITTCHNIYTIHQTSIPCVILLYHLS